MHHLGKSVLHCKNGASEGGSPLLKSWEMSDQGRCGPGVGVGDREKDKV